MSKYGFLNSYSKSNVGLKIGRSRFGFSHEHKTTFSSGYWFPVFCVEVLPGDTFSCKMKELVRMLTPVAPTMDNCILELGAYYVPNRLACKNIDDWKNICMGDGPDAWINGFDQTLITTGNVVNITAPVQSQSLASYLGIPINSSNVNYYKLSALPFNAVCRIWNEWLRDENTMDPIDWQGGIGSEELTAPLQSQTTKFLAAFKIKDYFTTALPAPQKGGAVYVPIGDSAPINFIQSVSPSIEKPRNPLANLSGVSYLGSYSDSTDQPDPIPAGNSYINMEADLSKATGASVNAIRMSFALQRLQEKLARGGSRYNEFLLSVFGVKAPTGMIEMSEFLGGASVPINVTQVLQTSSTNETSPLGSTGAFSNTYGDNLSFSKSFVDYGYLIIMATVRPVQSYSQGLPLMFRRYSPLDIYSPTFAFIGEQPIYTEELYYNSSTSRYNASGEVSNPTVFGYKEPWVEYKRPVSLVSGNLAPGAKDNTLASWTYTTNFTAVPTLSKSFLIQPPSQIAQTLIDTETSTQFLGDFVLEVVADRPMPANVSPGLIDHF